MNFDVKDGFLYLHDDTVPVHSRFEISMESDKYTDAQRKSFHCGYWFKGRVDIILLVEKTMFFSEGSSLGKYTLAIDSTP
jgi:hypothetical protein